MSGRTVRLTAPLAIAAAGTSIMAACADSTSVTRAVQSSSATPTTSAQQDPARCAEKAPSGSIDRQGYDLRFTRGHILISPRPLTASPAQAGVGGQVGAAGQVGADGQVAASASPTAQQMSSAPACYEFARWGEPTPDVPPESLLFVFKGDGTDGAQIEFPVGALTGEHLPPTDGPRPPVGPLTTSITATVGLSEKGTYRSSTTCTLTLTAMSSKRAAGSFDCPETIVAEQNPLDPDDDVPVDDDGAAPAATPAPAAAPTPGARPERPTSLTGWFDLQP
ncbi:hypothetical protein HGA00_06270 [Gordonia sputi]|nr:hypothetical protein [Gordonia sputi]